MSGSGGDSCLSDAQLEQLRADALPADDAAAARGHVERCAKCRARYDELCADDEFLADLRSTQRDRETGSGLPTLSQPGAHAGGAGPHLSEEVHHPGEQIGLYTLRERIGEGGMGVVYLADQKEPIRRRVALKLIKLGMDTKRVVARFESERQALAMMNHPNVASVLDAGATEQGRPYFVMEYVPGEPITTYCDKHQLSLPQRLDLFMQVCRAIQHAHQKGIIHRDIKPSNVLVMYQDGKATPKVIDFGVAKATDQRLTEKTIFTEHGLLIGTPEYMSPEQAEMTTLDIDTRTDVYSLGVLLYELLTGALPFDPESLRSAGFAAIQRIIREVDPSKPSTKLSDLLSAPGESGAHAAEKRRLDPSTLVRRLRGDLDWVTMKALEKDRTRRYDSASDLAADIKRHLRDEPVIAGPPSVGYRMSKFVRRNRAGVIAAAIVAVALIAGIAGTTWQAVVATHERNRAVLAEQEQSRARKEADTARQEAETARDAEEAQRKAAEQQRDKAEKINEFVTKALVSSDPNQKGTQGFLVTDAMKQAAALLDAGELKDQPETEAGLLLTISKILNGNAQSAEALRLAERALEITEQLHPGDDPAVATSLDKVATCLDSLGRSAEALPKFEASLEMDQRLFEGDYPDVARGLNDVALCLQYLGRSAEALPKFEGALKMLQRLFEGDHPDVATSLNNVALCLRSLGRSAEALPKYVASLEMDQRLFEGDHPDVARGLSNVAVCLESLGLPAEALPKLEAALEMIQRLFPGDHPAVATSLYNVAFCLRDLGRSAEALPKCEAALEMRRRLFEGDHPAVAQSLYNVASCLDSLARSSEALPKFEAALEMLRRVLPPGHPNTLYPQIGLARTLVSLGRHAEAEALLLDAAEQCERSEQSRQMHWQSVIEASVGLYDSWQAAEPDKGYDAQAAEWRAKMQPSDLASYLITRGLRLLEQGKHGDAEPLLRECAKIRKEVLAEGHWLIFNTMSILGESLAGQGKFAEAERTLLDGYEGLTAAAETIPEKTRDQRLREAIQRIVNLYDSWQTAEPGKGHDAKAAEWRAKLSSEMSAQPVAQPASGP